MSYCTGSAARKHEFGWQHCSIYMQCRFCHQRCRYTQVCVWCLEWHVSYLRTNNDDNVDHHGNNNHYNNNDSQHSGNNHHPNWYNNFNNNYRPTTNNYDPSYSNTFR
ncbi:hypothetical protein DPMN_075058 [Dreissena polymorpha]|uniref:Uncharacterized protein n=1 Tax=Dreissena polymorpha TaxID=45954 RepID=A0A9D3YIU9_DREPO|nr:hypothetical protein DPMN_075058 [Dreissena polymorpha]